MRGNSDKPPSWEWWYVRVIDPETGNKLPPNTVGRSQLNCICVFCDKQLSAQPNRIRAHLACFKSAATGNVAPCHGPRSSDEDSEAEALEKQRQYNAARAKAKQSVCYRNTST